LSKTMRVLLLTTEPQWGSWERKLAACRGGLGLTRNIGKVTIDLEEFDGEILTAGSKVDRAWFNTLTIDARARGYHAVVLHMGTRKARKVGVKQTLRGATINDEQIGEMYVIADEKQKVTYPSGRQVDRFTKVFLHEMSHWAAHVLDQPDTTHYWDYDKERIWQVMVSYTWPRNIFTSILSALRRERMVRPLSDWTLSKISQPFGAKNDHYKSGIHAGLDMACPVGTPVFAPTDGRVTSVWRDHSELGNACLYEFYFNGRMYTLRVAHLQYAPKIGAYRRGSQFAQTGNTGTSTGPHCHIELWKGGYEYDVLLREDTIRERLLNPFVFFRSLSN